MQADGFVSLKEHRLFEEDAIHLVFASCVLTVRHLTQPIFLQLEWQMKLFM